jgi:hypothetical protein
VHIVDKSVVTRPVVKMASRTRFLRQYFAYIRLNAVRVGATTVDARFDPVAFRNTNGKFVVVVKADAAGTFTVRGLPAGTYEIRYTTDTDTHVDGGTVPVTAGQSLSASIPAPGALTIFAK